MIFDDFTLIATRALKGYDGLGTLRITAIEPDRRGPMVRWAAPGLATRRSGSMHELAVGQRGPVPGPVLLDLLAGTLAARWKDGSPHCPVDWGERLIKRHRRVFQLHVPATGPGWCWLWHAGAEAIRRAGLPPAFKTDDAKEKFGSIRWYHQSDEDSAAVDDIVEAVESLSGFICEDCGRPGRIRQGSWIRCQCDAHAKKK